jgi:hypothetical protein
MRQHQRTADMYRKEMLQTHLDNSRGEATAVCGDRAISAYNPKRIFRSRTWDVLQRPEQKLYTFCFDKRIMLDNFDTLPYGYKSL